MLGVRFRVEPSNVPEERGAEEEPAAYVERLARAKAMDRAARTPDHWVLAGDTVVAFQHDVLEKPGSDREAVEMLLRLNARTHTVYSGLALVTPSGVVKSRVDAATVRFRGFDRTTAERYVATGEPLDKAGAYGIQGIGACLVERVEGDFYTVVGLSVAGLVALFEVSQSPFRILPDLGES